MIRIRDATAGDAEAIARIHVAAWRRAYAHILPADFLNALDEADRAEGWRARLGTAAQPDSPTVVAVDAADTPLGFAQSGRVREGDLDPKARAELYTCYVEPDSWRRGVGTALLQAVEAFWRPRGVAELVLWVFEENAAGRAFYERLGWRPDGSRQVEEFGGVQRPELRYRRTLDAGTV